MAIPSLLYILALDLNALPGYSDAGARMIWIGTLEDIRQQRASQQSFLDVRLEQTRIRLGSSLSNASYDLSCAGPCSW